MLVGASGKVRRVARGQGQGGAVVDQDAPERGEKTTMGRLPHGRLQAAAEHLQKEPARGGAHPLVQSLLAVGPAGASGDRRGNPLERQAAGGHHGRHPQGEVSDVDLPLRALLEAGGPGQGFQIHRLDFPDPRLHRQNDLLENIHCVLPFP